MNTALDYGAAQTATTALARWHAQAYVAGTILDSNSWTMLPMVPRGCGIRNYQTTLVDGVMSVRFQIYSLHMPKHVLTDAWFQINSENCKDYLRG